MVAGILAVAAFMVAGVQIVMYGHLLRNLYFWGYYVPVGWVISILSLCALICLGFSATYFDRGVLHRRISLGYMIPLAVSFTLLAYSSTQMLTAPVIVVKQVRVIELPAAWSR